MPEPPEQNKLGLWTSTSLVIGNMIGSGVFLMPAALAAYGGISVVGWIVSSIGALLLAKLYSNLSKLMPKADGGPYAYTRAGLGDFAGFLVAWGYWISIWCTNAAISVSFVSALSSFFPLLASSSLAAVATGLSAIWFLTWINSLGVATTGRLQLVTTILKIIPLLLVTVGGLFFLDRNNFVPLNTSGGSTFAAVAATATTTFFAFLGLECATIPSGSVVNPGKTIPRATMLGTLVATAIYILSSVSVMGMIPARQLQQSVTPFADAAALIWGEQARYWVSAGVAVAAFGALNGWILVQGQVPYAIASDKLFPAIFSKKNRRQVPATGIVIGSLLVSVLLVMNYTKGLAEQFKFLILLTTIVTLVPYIFSTAAYLLIRVRIGPGSTALATGAFLFSLFAMAGSGHEVVYDGFILLMTALPFYVLIKWRSRP